MINDIIMAAAGTSTGSGAVTTYVDDVFNAYTYTGTGANTFSATNRTLPVSANWQSVAYGNGLFVIVGTGANCLTSTDGVTWTSRSMPGNQSWRSVTYGNGKFVAVASGSGSTSTAAASSTDGITWTYRTMPSTANWNSVTYGNGKFVAVSITSSNAGAYSTDGITWTASTLSASQDWYSVAYGNGTYVAVANNTNAVTTSSDGITWTSRTPSLAATRPMTGITYGNSTFVVVSGYSISATAVTMTSSDGITWTNRNMPYAAPWTAVTFGNGFFLAIDNSSGQCATSTDGITWTTQTLPSAYAFSSAAFGTGSRFVIVADINDPTRAATIDLGGLTITDNIDRTSGALDIFKDRSTTNNWAFYDTTRGVFKEISSNLTNSTTTQSQGVIATTSTSISVGTASTVNTASDLYLKTTFKKSSKFFDIVSYTGTGANRTVSHNLGIAPGMIWVKRLDTTGSWMVYHNALSNTQNIVLNTTAAAVTDATAWNSTTATTSVFSLGTNADVNASGGSYIAYLFAHNSASDGLIQCGSFTTDGSGNATLSLNWEPQFIIAKNSGATAEWKIVDSARGWSATSSKNALINPNTTATETTNVADLGFPNVTGADVKGLSASSTYIYMAIRRPNKQPTAGSQVFSPTTSAVSAGTKITTGFSADLQLFSVRGGGSTDKNQVYDRLRGVSTNTTDSGIKLVTSSTGAENAAGNETRGFDSTGFQMPTTVAGLSTIFWNFKRAPGFFEQICYTGTGANKTESHNLGVAPNLWIVKRRNATAAWQIGSSLLANTEKLDFSTAAKATDATAWNSTFPTTSTISLGTNNTVNANGGSFTCYMFATLAGISKVGTYTGNGSSQTINCSFSAGARFVLIKRTDSTGAWYIWDTARGIISANDPYLVLNSSTTDEVTTDDSIDPDSSGFIVNQSATTDINVSSATYLYLAIA